MNKYAGGRWTSDNTKNTTKTGFRTQKVMKGPGECGGWGRVHDQ